MDAGQDDLVGARVPARVHRELALVPVHSRLHLLRVQDGYLFAQRCVCIAVLGPYPEGMHRRLVAHRVDELELAVIPEERDRELHVRGEIGVSDNDVDSGPELVRRHIREPCRHLRADGIQDPVLHGPRRSVVRPLRQIGLGLLRPVEPLADLLRVLDSYRLLDDVTLQPIPRDLERRAPDDVPALGDRRVERRDDDGALERG